MIFLLECRRRIATALKTADTTKLVHIGAGLMADVPYFFQECFGDQFAVIVADTNTFSVAGQTLFSLLHKSPCKTLSPWIFREPKFYAHTDHVQALQSYLAATDAIPIAVGSGTINDITKLAAHRCNRPYMVFTTAASMDGYTAFGASITHDGFKQTFFCPAPAAVVIDLDVIGAAPSAMNSAGYADLLAKIPAGADWLLADALGLDPIDQRAWALVQGPLRSWLADPDGVKEGSVPSLAGLMEGLVMSGLAMQKTKSSRPASGAEHQFSHLWDNQHLRYKDEIPFHGFKVAIGSLASAALYHKMLQKPADQWIDDPQTVTKYWPSRQEIEQRVAKEFPEQIITDQVLLEIRAKYCPALEIAQRLTQLKRIWPDLRSRLQEQLLSAEQMRQWLERAGAPTRPVDIGISRERLQKSYYQAQLLRRRYTILDLVFESGLWQVTLDSLFTPQGFWHAYQEPIQ